MVGDRQTDRQGWWVDAAKEGLDHTIVKFTELPAFSHIQGLTKLLLTRIPHYREVIITSFSCEACGMQNNETQSGGRIQEKVGVSVRDFPTSSPRSGFPNLYPRTVRALQGIEFRLTVEEERDLSRRVVQGDSASVRFPSVDLEIPAGSRRGAVTTVEGILRRVLDGLGQDQPARRAEHPEDAEQIDLYCRRVEEELLRVREPFQMVREYC